MTRTFVLFFLFAHMFFFNSSAQTLTIGLGAGIAEYIGDVKFARGDPKQYAEAYGMYIAYNFNKRWELHIDLNRGTLKGDDALAIDPNRVQRNLHFKNVVTELGMRMRYNILVEPKLQVYSKSKTHFTPYLFGGIAGFFNNPKAIFEQDWHELQPLGTEGQFLPDSKLQPYSRIQLSLPMGLGFSYRMQKLIISAEVGYRMTFTDYLDDVSSVYPDQLQLARHSGRVAAQLSRRSDIFSAPGDRRGNAKAKDAYIISMIRIGYILGR